MSSAEAAWTRLHALAEQARQAAATRQQLEIRLSPDESTGWLVYWRPHCT